MKDLVVLDGLAESLILEKQSYIKKLLTYFLIGKAVNESHSHLNVPQLADMIGCQVNTLQLCKRIATYFKNDVVAFKHFIEANPNIRSLTAIKKALFNESPKTSDATIALNNALRNIINTANSLGFDDRAELIKKANKSLNHFRSKLPDSLLIGDTNYIKYNECVFCGAYPPPEEGFTLKFLDEFGFERVALPICNECIKNEIEEPDWKLVAKLYCGYAVELDNAFENIYK